MTTRPLILVLLFAAAGCGGGDEDGVSAPFFPGIKTHRTIEIAGLRDRVEVLNDDQGVPHIYAKNEADAMAIQGYVSARDRFMQMELIRKAAAGRVSELFGKLSREDTREADLEARRINMTERGTMVFDEMLAVLEPHEQVRLLAYARGVNAWIADAKAGRNGAKAAVEFTKNPFISAQELKFADVAEWTVADSFAVGRLQQWNLAGSLGDELKAGRLRAKMPADFYSETQRFAPVDTTLSIENFFAQKPVFTGLAALGGIKSLATQAELTPEEKRAFAAQLGATLERLRNPGRVYDGSWPGSNNWVVGPKLTGGSAMLANDPHLALLNPPLFYNTHLNTARFGKGRWDTIGVTFPGIPGLLIGHNRHVAWGVTTLGYDVMDLYKEELQGQSVKFKGDLVPVAYSKQTIQYGTGADAEFEEVDMPYVPHHGAVVSGEEALAGKKADLITMKWTGREVTRDFRAFFDLLSARSIDDFFAAVHYFDIGAQSFVGADVEGNIGFFGHALVPKRPWDLEKNTPDAPLPGAGGFEWSGYLPDAELTQAKNPAKGYIATANNDLVGTTLDNNPFNDEQYYWYWQDLGFRIGRISQLIEEISAKGSLTLEDMETIQNDTYSLEGERVVPMVLALLAATDATWSQDVTDAVGYLSRWQFGTPTGVKSEFRGDEPTPAEKEQAVAVSIYYRFQDILRKRILEDEYESYGEGAPGSFAGSKFMIYALENLGTASDTAHWFDDIRTTQVTETATDIVVMALEDTLVALAALFETADMAAWQWGKFHRVEAPDVISMAAPKSFNTNGPVANDGAQYTVDVGGNNGEGLQRSGAQIRFVVELKKDAIVSRSVLPGGQVGDPESPHHADQWELWVTNRRLPLRFYDADVEANTEEKWVFLPR